MKILIVEDDKNLARTLFSVLEKHGYSVKLSFYLDRALDIALSESFDLIILDLYLGDKTGDTFLKEIREKNIKTPVLVLTAASELSKKVELFDIGADDYLTKPFHLEELIVRVRALLRRTFSDAFNTIKCGPIEIDFHGKKVLKDNKEIKLTKAEFLILYYLCINKNIYVSKEDLIEKVLQNNPETNSLEVLISRIRSKLGMKDFIISARGLGYRINET